MKRTILLLVAAVLLIGIVAQQAAGQSVQEKNKALLKQVYESMSADNWNKLSEILAPNMVDHNAMPDQKPGIEGVRELFKTFRQAFPDFKMTSHEMVAEGDWVSSRVTMSGTHKGEFMGTKATNKKFSIQGFDLLRFQIGKIVERWGTFDNAAMMMQLGMMKPPGQAAGGKAEKKK